FKCCPDMVQKRCRAGGVVLTWRRNDVGAEAFPRHGAKAMSGQRCCPDMAQKRCRARGVSPTWQKSDVGPEVFPRHGTKAMSGWRRCPDMAKKRCRYSQDRKSTRLNSSHVSISY